MSYSYSTEPLLELFLFETSQLVEQLEQAILNLEKENSCFEETVNEIFRIMHTIKGSAAMMQFEQLATLAHSVEDIFYYLRKEKPVQVDYSELSDIVLQSIDFIKTEMDKIKNQQEADGNATGLMEQIKCYYHNLKENQAQGTPGLKAYKAVVYFEDGCEMENIRAYTLIHNLKDMVEECTYIPADILDSDESIPVIRQNGFHILFKSACPYEKLLQYFQQTIFLKDLEFLPLDEQADGPLDKPEESMEVSERVGKKDRKEEMKENSEEGRKEDRKEGRKVGSEEVKKEDKKEDLTNKPVAEHPVLTTTATQSIISVSVQKLDKLLDLVGEMVLAEAMVVQNPDLEGLQLTNFRKASRQLGKITNEIQDIVMSIRMVPLSATFHKMHRIVRDMSKKLEKEVQLEIIGEETEVDKNIIEHISDPLMHLVRNSIDHGLEAPQDRLAAGKDRVGKVTLEARNSGSDVLIIGKDDGRGINRQKVLQRAKDNNLLVKPEQEMTDQEIFGLILLPGFSTKDCITEYSGRGVGMDVVTKNIEHIGGSITVDSQEGMGTVITIKIPLTLAIIDGMNLQVGQARYTIPMNAIKESFRPSASNIIRDPDGNEMLMVRGNCYPILRLHQLYKIDTGVTELTDGIIVMVEQEGKISGVFSDALLGQQQVVVKALPTYLQRFKRLRSLAGCTLLGDGSISLILDAGKLINAC